MYTLGNTITVGGHFLHEDTMHLTEWCRLVAHTTQQQGTNAIHPGFMRAISRMIMAMIIRSPMKGMFHNGLSKPYTDDL